MNRTDLMHNKIDKIGRFFKKPQDYNELEEDDAPQEPSQDKVSNDESNKKTESLFTVHVDSNVGEGTTTTSKSTTGKHEGGRKPLAPLSQATTPDGFPITKVEKLPLRRNTSNKSRRKGPRGDRDNSDTRSVASRSVRPPRAEKDFIELNHIERLIEGKGLHSERSSRSAFNALAAAADDNASVSSRSTRRGKRTGGGTKKGHTNEKKKSSLDKFFDASHREQIPHGSNHASTNHNQIKKVIAGIQDELGGGVADDVSATPSMKGMMIKNQRVMGGTSSSALSVECNSVQLKPPRKLAAWELREMAKRKPAPKCRTLASSSTHERNLHSSTSTPTTVTTSDNDDDNSLNNSLTGSNDWDDWDNESTNRDEDCSINSTDDMTQQDDDVSLGFGTPIVHHPQDAGTTRKLSAWELRELSKNQIRRPVLPNVKESEEEAIPPVPSAFRHLCASK